MPVDPVAAAGEVLAQPARPATDVENLCSGAEPELLDDVRERPQAARELVVRWGVERLRPQPALPDSPDLLDVGPVRRVVVLPEAREPARPAPGCGATSCRRPTLAGREPLRRRPPLPRAVPQPVPPRSVRAVPRLGARPGLDADQPDRADGRLHARLLGAPARRRHRVLPALRADRAAPWVFFQASLQISSSSLVGQASLVKQVRFPRQLLPLSVVATNFVTFAAMFAVILPLNLIFLPETRTTFWAALPLLLPACRARQRLAIVLASATVSSVTSSTCSRPSCCRGSS